MGFRTHPNFQTSMHSSRAPTDLVEYEKLLRAIGKYCHPDPVNLPDLPGVVGKRLLDPETRHWSATTPLTAEEQTLLRQLVLRHAGGKPNALPPLQTVMGHKERLTFRRAFRQIEGRPGWEPVLRTPEDRWRLQRLRGDVHLRHDAALKKQIVEERMRHFDDHRIQTTPHFKQITYLLRDEVQAYLNRVGLELNALLVDLPENPPSTDLMSFCNSENSPCADVARAFQNQKRTRHNWSTEHRRIIIEAARLGRLGQLAAEYGLSFQYAKQLATRFEHDAEVAQHQNPSKAPPLQSSRHVTGHSLPVQTTPANGAKLPTATITASMHQGGHPPGVTNLRDTPQSQTSSIHRVRPQNQVPALSFVLRIGEVEKRIGLKRSSIYERLKAKSKYYDPTFPRPVSLAGGSVASSGDDRRSSAVGFREDEIERWLAGRVRR